MTDEQNAAIQAEREAYAAYRDAQAVVTRKFAAVHDGTGDNPTEAELALAAKTKAAWEKTKAQIEKLRTRR